MKEQLLKEKVLFISGSLHDYYEPGSMILFGFNTIVYMLMIHMAIAT